MKRKILALGILTLCCLGMSVNESQAGIFSHWCLCNRCTTQITCRPYNAFTPMCWGNLVCDGCCPSMCGGGGGCMPMAMSAPPWACGGGSCGPMGCASDMARPGGPMPPVNNGPSFTPPMPMPVGPNTTMMYPPHMMYPPTMQMPGAPTMPVMYPPQMPMPMPVAPNTTTMYPPMMPDVSQAAYNPSYYPIPYPNYYMPNYYNPYGGYPQQMPSYWYGR